MKYTTSFCLWFVGGLYTRNEEGLRNPVLLDVNRNVRVSVTRNMWQNSKYFRCQVTYSQIYFEILIHAVLGIQNNTCEMLQKDVKIPVS